MNTLATAIVWCVIQVTLFGVLAGLLYLASHRQDPRWRAHVLLASLVGVVLLTVMIGSSWPDWSSAIQRLAFDSPRIDSTVAVTSDLVQQSQSGLATTAPDGNRPEIDIQESAIWTEAARAAWNELRRTPDSLGSASIWSWRTVVVVSIVAIAIVGLTRLVGGLIGVALLRRKATPLNESRLMELSDVLKAELQCPRPIALGECSRLATAATVGWRRPLVLLPTNWRAWTPSELRSVLAHEIAHVSRADFATHFLAQIGLALHFYHPLVHWLVRRLRLEQELAADAAAARVAGGHQSYLTNLAGLALAQPSVRPGWPVQAFLPSRGMLLRRIEMLRDRKVSQLVVSRAARLRGWLGVFVLIAAGVAAAGLRAPTVAVAQVAESESAVETDQQEMALTFVEIGHSQPVKFMVEVRPAMVFSDPRMQPLAEIVEELMQVRLPSLALNEIEQIKFVQYDTKSPIPGDPESNHSKVIVIHVSQAVDLSKRKLLPEYSKTLPEGIHCLPFSRDDGRLEGYLILDDNTIVIDKVAQLRKLLADPKIAPWANRTVNNPPFQLLAQTEVFHEMLEGAMRDPNAAPLMAFAPLWKETTAVQVTLDLGDSLKIQAEAFCQSPEDAQHVEKTVQAALTLAQNAIDQKWAEAKKQFPPFATPDDIANSKKLVDVTKEMLASAKITREQEQIVRLDLTARVDIAHELSFLLPAVLAARDAAQRSQSMNNLKNIGLAMLNYHDANGHFPPAVLYGPDGKTPYSWRVALLPYLDDQASKTQYNFNEPWDSPNNLKVLEMIPGVYRHPKDSPQSTNTSYFVLTGPETVFSGKEGTKVQDITDGTSRTLLIVEAKREIPWTKPEDIPYSADAPLPELGGWANAYFNVAFCDGSAYTVSEDLDEVDLRGVITKAGKEIVHMNRLPGEP